MLKDVLQQVKRLAEEDYAFVLGALEKDAQEWVHREGFIGDQVVPKSWAETLATIGWGEIRVKSSTHEPYRLDFNLGGPALPPTGVAEGWLIVGDDLAGDMLCVFAPPGPQQPDGRIGILSHEDFEFMRTWDSVEDFWKTVLEMHELGEKKKIVRYKQPPKPHESSEPKTATVKSNGWTQCPHCNFNFYTKCNRIWVEGRHTRCGGRIQLK